MLTTRYLNNALNSIYERALRLIYNDYVLPFDRILEDKKQKSIHQKKHHRFNTTDQEWRICNQGKQL